VPHLETPFPWLAVYELERSGLWLVSAIQPFQMEIRGFLPAGPRPVSPLRRSRKRNLLVLIHEKRPLFFLAGKTQTPAAPKGPAGGLPAPRPTPVRKQTPGG